MQAVALRQSNVTQLADRDAVEHLVRDCNESPVHLDEHTSFYKAREFSFRAGFGLADFLVENHHCILWIKPLIAFLCIRQIKFVERLNNRVCRAEQSL